MPKELLLLIAMLDSNTYMERNKAFTELRNQVIEKELLRELRFERTFTKWSDHQKKCLTLVEDEYCCRYLYSPKRRELETKLELKQITRYQFLRELCH